MSSERPWLAHYPAGVPAEIDLDEFASINDIFDSAVQKYRDKTAFISMGKSITYGELERLSRDFAGYLLGELKLKKGDRVAIMMPNCLQYPVAILGVLRAGLTVVNTNPMYTARELKHQLVDSGASVLVVMDNFGNVAQEVLVQVPGVRAVTTGLGDMLGFPKGLIVNFVLKHVKKMVPDFDIPGAVRFRDTLTLGRMHQLPEVRNTPEDLAFLQYTGGTTGVSKGAMLTHGNLSTNVAMFAAWTDAHVVKGDEVVVTALPLYHIFALMVNFLSYFKAGATNVLIPNPRDMEGFVREWSKWRVTAFTGVNTLFAGLMHTPGFAQLDFSALRVCMGGGAPVQKAISNRWQGITGRPITEGYGLSETSPILTANLLDAPEATGCIGIPMPSTEISIRDDDGNAVAMGEAGELCAKGPQVMRGYWQNDEANAKSFTADGFFRTGDVAVQQPDGFFRIVDRKKDMILVSGFNVYPNEVEDVLAHLDGLVESAVVGVPDERSGEAVKAFVVTKRPMTEDEVIAHCRANLAAYKVPRSVVFKDELPKSTVGKILRRELRDA